MKNCVNITSLGIAYADISERAIVSLLQKLGPQLQYLNISWLCSTCGTLNQLISGDNLTEALVSTCLQLVELDICGVKSLIGPNLLYLIDVWIQKVSEID